MMDPDEDYITIAATEQQTATTKANRKKELEEAHANLKGPFLFTYLIPFNEVHIVLFYSPLPRPRRSTYILHPTPNSPHSSPARHHLERLRRNPPIPR
jgi:hypothetical protein